MYDDFDTQIQCEEVYDFQPTIEDYMTPCGLVEQDCDCFVCVTTEEPRYAENE